MRIHNWMAVHWVPAAAFIYTFICLCDFVIFPIYVGLVREDILVLVESLKHLDPSIQVQLIKLEHHTHEPFTLKGAAMFHIAFGALLTSGGFKGKGVESGLVYTKNGAEFKRRSDDVIEPGSRID